MIIFTSICANYVHKARTLAQSVRRYIPDARFYVCLVERKVDPRIPAEYFDGVVLARDAWEGNFDRFIFKHSIVEASTAVKGQFFRYLFKRFPQENAFVYLDPDCRVYSDFVELRALLETRPIVLCPHLLCPGNIDMELSSTAHGVYNLGFLGVNHSAEAERFIDWWAERLYLFCYDDIQRGIFTDQKWIDLAPCFFDVHVLKHHGYDFAPWSLKGARIAKEDGRYTIMGEPLRFIHFSGFGKVAEKCMADWMDEDGRLFRELYDHYAREHDANNADLISRAEWSYGEYASGESISTEIRALYRGDYDVMFAQEDPFACSNAYFAEKLLLRQAEEDSLAGRAASLARRFRRAVREEGLAAAGKKAIGKLRGGLGRK